MRHTPEGFRTPDPTKWAKLVTVTPEGSTVLLVAGVCAVVTGFGVGGTAARVNTSAPATSVATHPPAETTPDTLASQAPPRPAALLPASPAAPAPPGNCTASPRNATPSQNRNQTIT
ncbi:MAG: hypothetical protein ACREBC_38185, partial [Pyrinomonadaceae bacterium]